MTNVNDYLKSAETCATSALHSDDPRVMAAYAAIASAYAEMAKAAAMRDA
jgi:hypothetical protein